MRTTIDLNDTLFRRAKMEAASRGISMKNLIEDGVRLALKTGKKPSGQRVKFPIFPPKSKKKIVMPLDAAYRAELEEDLERHAASS